MKIILDTGPLVAFLDQSDHYNYRVGKVFSGLKPPLYTCEAVISETVFLLQRGNINPDLMFEMVKTGDLIIKPVLNNASAIVQIRKLIQNYQNLPASFADASLVYMYEKYKNAALFTLDRDFTIYRTSNGALINSLISL